MKQIQGFVGSLLLMLSTYANCDQSQQAISFGVFPYISAEKLVSFHTPLKILLSEALGQPVTLVSAPDFATFIKNTRGGEYDYILTAPHLARLAEVESDFQRVAFTLHRVQGVYLVHEDSGIERLQDLEGSTIMIAEKRSILYQMSKQQLREMGLEDGKNITIVETRTHNNAMWAPLRSETDAAVTGIRLFSRLDHENKDQLRVIDQTPSAPGLMIMAHSRQSSDEVTRVQNAVTSYADTPAGEKYFARTGSLGFGLITDAMMLGLDLYIPQGR